MRPASPQLSMGSNKGAAERDQRGCLGKPGAHVSGAAIRQGGWSAASQCCRAHLANVGLGQLLLARGAGPAAGDLARVDLCRGWAGWEAQVSGKWGQATRCMRLTGAPMSLPASSAEPGRDQGWLAGWLAGRPLRAPGASAACRLRLSISSRSSTQSRCRPTAGCPLCCPVYKLCCQGAAGGLGLRRVLCMLCPAAWRARWWTTPCLAR